jgi:phosphoribosylanthranilate isomerase
VLIKICGITNPDDGHAAVAYGATALGFIFHPPSPRYIAQDDLADWIGEFPTSVRKVGVFVDRPAAEVEAVCSRLKLDVAQLHGHEHASDIPRRVAVWKAVRVRDRIDAAFDRFPVEALLLDGPSSGRAFDWSLARSVTKPVILAGGLNENNVADAILAAHPWGIDACSCLEASPGKKDHVRMERFINACTTALTLTQ